MTAPDEPSETPAPSQSRHASGAPMGVAVLGGGYVADYYMGTRSAHPELHWCGVHDIDPDRKAAFAAHHGLPAYQDYDALLADDQVEIILNLTNPRAHFETTRRALNAGKHVYSEKPLAMASAEAKTLATLAAEKGLSLSTAPCSLLSEGAQTLWKGVKDGRIGKPRLVYASFDDGMVHRHHPETWRGVSGSQWPAKDEFEIGCTYEHAAYVLSWLAMIFGPARRVTSFAGTCLPDKGVPVDAMAPDFTSGVIEYDDNVVARVTCSIVAPIDKSIVITGDEGVLYTKYVRNDAGPVYWKGVAPTMFERVVKRVGAISANIEQAIGLPFSIGGPSIERKIPFARKPGGATAGGGRLFARGGVKPVDFLRGPAEMVAAIRENRPSRLPATLGVHMIEIIETLQYPERFESPRVLTTDFPAIEPLPWS